MCVCVCVCVCMIRVKISGESKMETGQLTARVGQREREMKR